MSKDTKAVLKEAKEHLKQKEYSIALKLCKKVLKEDKRNYNALVLMGATMREVETLKSQAPASLKKAIDIQPNNPLAWHGLLVYYEEQENKPEAWPELVNVYNKLLQLESDSSKFFQYLQSLAKILVKLNDESILSETIAILCKLREKDSISLETVQDINNAMTAILTQYSKLPIELDEILEQLLCYTVKDEDSPNRHEYYKKYLKLLYKFEKIDVLMTEAAIMHSMFPQDIYPLEWVCRAYSEFTITHKKYEGVDINFFYDILLDHDPESLLGHFAKAVHLYEVENLIDARNLLNSLVNVKQKWFHAWFLLGKINVLLQCWDDVEMAATHALKLIPEDDPHNLRPTINMILLEALVKNSNKLKWKKAEDLFNELSDGSIKSLILRAHLHVSLKAPDASDLVQSLKNDPQTKTEGTILHAIELLQKRYLEEAADVLGSILESSEAWLTLGKIHWEMSDFGHSTMAFLKAIQANSNNWECLVYLGQYHQEHSKDYERSRKCYQKALQINPNSNQAGIGLSLVHRLLKNTDANFKFLTELTSQNQGPKWALIQLGLQYLDHNNPTQAASILQKAVKLDSTDSNCWECLADAYLARGAHLSALKSYERAYELNPDSFYSITQLANIKLLVGNFASAKLDFENILQQSQNNVAALKGLAECCYKLGKDHAAAQLLARARDDFQEAVDNTTKTIIQDSKFLCIWKMMGDICYNVAILPEKYCFLHVVPGLIQSNSQENSVLIKRKDIFLLAIRCYCRALSMSQTSSLLWHDLARCYLDQLNFDKSIDNKEVIKKSLAAAKESVKLNPSNWFHWNLLGVICMSNLVKNYALAQHSFVMAIEKQSNNAVAWTNLGALYLLLEDQYRANEAFSWAQKIDPAYVNCWIGQAFIAEKVSQKDAMDLFRHATQLDYHHEAATGYTHWVIKTIMDPESKKDPLYSYVIEKMHALTVASDGIHWYIVHNPHDPYALNSYGLLLERQKLYKPSFEQFSNALKYVSNDKQKDQLSINLARVMMHLGKCEEAVKMCLSVKSASFGSHCQLALSLFKAEHFKESYEAYEAALHWLADAESDKAHVLCAMAAMAYMFQESNDAKTLLYQAVGIKPPIISGLLALAALGMLDGDENLTHLVLKELKAHDNNYEYKNHIAKLFAYSFLIQNDMEGAARVLCKYIHRYPDSSELWTSLARILLIMNDVTFNKCVDKALFLGRNLSNEQIAKVKCMSSLSALITSSPQIGLRSVLNTVHSFPASADSWSNLIAALLPRWSKESQFNAHWLMVLASRVRNSFTCTRGMEQWLLKNEKKANDIAYC